MGLYKMETHGVYQVLDDNMEVVYIGSTKLKLEWLENNHRKWQELNYSETKFRKALVEKGQNWTFAWALEPDNVSREYIEICEGALIRYVTPTYNVSMKPYERSIQEGRYEKTC